jgi:hypothetical protein
MIRAIVFMLLCCCAACATASKATESQLAHSAQLLMEARARGDWGAYYDQTSRSFQATMTREAFLALPRQVNIQNPEVIAVSSGESGQGLVDVRYDIVVMGFVFSGKQERLEWLWEQGQWRYVPEVAKMPPG